MSPVWRPRIRPPQDPTTAAVASETDGRLAITGVYLLTRQDGGTEAAVPGMGVVVDARGVAVWTPDRTLAALLPWENLERLTTRTGMHMPDGHEAVVLEAVTPVRTHRFAVPTDDPGGLQAAVAGLAETHHKAGRGGASPALLGVLLVAVALVVALVVLAAFGAL